MSRVIVPRNPDDLTGLIDLIIQKETALGASKTFTDAELTSLSNFNEIAKKASADQKEYKRLSEEKTVERDNALGLTKGMSVDQPGSAMFLVTQLRDILLTKNKTNAKVLGEWGFEVDDSPQPSKPPKANP
jgi:hypothetical protein